METYYYWFITSALMIASYYIGMVAGYSELKKDVMDIIEEENNINKP